MDQDDDYTVGYGKPPKATQFRKGRSGNPKGRPKTPTGPDSHLARELSKQITVTENGQRKRISKLEALTTQLVNRAVSGEPAALRIITRYLDRVQTKSDALAAAQLVKQESENPKDYTDQELAELVAAALQAANTADEVL